MRPLLTEFLLNMNYTSEECKRRSELEIRKGTMTCEPCGRSLDSVQDYLRHETHQHAAKLYDDNDAEWKCHSCRFAFKTENLLFAHLRNMREARTRLTTRRIPQLLAPRFAENLAKMNSIVIVLRQSSTGESRQGLIEAYNRAGDYSQDIAEAHGLRITLHTAVIKGSAPTAFIPIIPDKKLESAIRENENAKTNCVWMRTGTSEAFTDAVEKALQEQQRRQGFQMAFILGLDAYACFWKRVKIYITKVEPL